MRAAFTMTSLAVATSLWFSGCALVMPSSSRAAALRWTQVPLRRSAAVADAPAQDASLAEQTDDEMAELDRLAAAGDPDAQYRWAKELRRGRRVPQDLDRAFQIILEAADQEHVKAQNMAGLMLVKGEGTDADPEVGLFYLSRAAEAGLLRAQFACGVMHYNGLGLEEKDTLGAAFWWKKAADRGHIEAQFRLGGMLLSGDGLETNATWAADYFRRAAEQGHAKGQEAIGLLLRRGIGVQQDQAAAVRWLAMAAEQGVAEACFELGTMYRRGDGVPKDVAAGLRWFQQGAELGHAESAGELGIMLLTGEGGDIDEDGAAYWLDKADCLERKPGEDDEDGDYEDG